MVRTADKNAHCPPHLLYPCNLHDLPATSKWNLFHQICISQLLYTKMLDVRYGQTIQGLCDELNLVPLYVSNDQNLGLCQIVQRQVCDGISRDALLYQQHVAARGFDLLDHPQNIVSLLLQNPVHLGVVRNHDAYIGFRGPLNRASEGPPEKARHQRPEVPEERSTERLPSS
ncbi:protein kinase superfamily protein [Striga asiatica]|uniref:Protein kinase superfamily protein n=1 Tax=Striga asiatica TaxID=4170 RepID=A0A5A7R1A9_STRAF|nr:protein kinase superfamily protein [Striga asiatica]